MLAGGVAILIRNSLNITIQQSEISLDARFIVLEAAINNETYMIANIYIDIWPKQRRQCC